MANQFVARKGLIALDDSQITGSLDVSGSISASFFSGDGSGLSGVSDFPYTGSAIISGSLEVTGSIETTSNLGVNGSGSFGNNQFLIGSNVPSNAATGFNSTFEFQNGPTTYSSQLVFRPKGNQVNYNESSWGWIRFDPQNVSGLSIYAANYRPNIVFGRGEPSSTNPSAFAKLNDSGLKLQSSYMLNIGTAEERLHVVGNGKFTGFITASGNLITEANITASGHVSASTYYGDGSNLTGIGTDPFPYTGSAVISGSLEVTGSVSASTYYGDGSNLTGISSDPFPYTGDVEITGSNSLAGSYALKVANSSGTDILTVENDSNTRINGKLGINTNNSVSSSLKIIDPSSSNTEVIIGTRTNNAGTHILGFAHHTNAASIATGIISKTTTASGNGTMYLCVRQGSDGSRITTSDAVMGLQDNNVTFYQPITYNQNTFRIGANNSGDTYFYFRPESKVAIASKYLGSYNRGDFRVLTYPNADSTVVNITDHTRLLITGDGQTEISGSLTVNQGLDVTGDVSASTYYGDGSNLTGISSDPFPYTGSAIISGSLTVTGSFNALLPTSSTDTYFVTYNTSSYELEARQVATLINPKVEYLDVTASISSGTSITLPNGLSYISSSTYEYLEVFFNGLRLRYDRDFVPTSITTIQNQIAFPSGSELTFKSLKA